MPPPCPLHILLRYFPPIPMPRHNLLFQNKRRKMCIRDRINVFEEIPVKEVMDPGIVHTSKMCIRDRFSPGTQWPDRTFRGRCGRRFLANRNQGY